MQQLEGCSSFRAKCTFSYLKAKAVLVRLSGFSLKPTREKVRKPAQLDVHSRLPSMKVMAYEHAVKESRLTVVQQLRRLQFDVQERVGPNGAEIYVLVRAPPKVMPVDMCDALTGHTGPWSSCRVDQIQLKSERDFCQRRRRPGRQRACEARWLLLSMIFVASYCDKGEDICFWAPFKYNNREEYQRCPFDKLRDCDAQLNLSPSQECKVGRVPHLPPVEYCCST